MLRLGSTLLIERLWRRSRADPGAVICRWARARSGRGGDIAVRIFRRAYLLVTSGESSRSILDPSPAKDGLPPGRSKRNAMSFLAPRALTIAPGQDWARLREFHERALAFDDGHPLAQRFLAQIRAAFSPPVRSSEDVRSAMAQVMLGIVPGVADPRLASDVQAMFEAVQSPVRRRLLGIRYRPIRRRLYGHLRSRVRQPLAADADNLLDLARNKDPPADEEEFIQQIPHWMFTFTGSGTDLLTRTLAMITSRPAVHRQALDELSAAGAPDQATTVGSLKYLEACLLETGRLFPPVRMTFHRSKDGEQEIIHYFPLLHRDPALGASVDAYRPERWLDPAGDAITGASSLFLRGPRSCPGQGLILFVCKAALAQQLGEIGMRVRTTRLSVDPLPVTFPESEAHFQPEGSHGD
ncbi:cytochrome P450 [Thioalkalivibrio denitrificans]|uniref:cytochrome P450 n=1 Tax=Thioalkalivibrio denitrificans TaxID=108003 RepID=UPI00158B3D3B|nr:cytochrome P450 [Thioalkalivibrio denitrificans]